MQRVQLIVGKWKVTAVPKESKEEPWTERHDWSFQIEKERYSLRLTVTDGKLLKEGLLTYDLKRKLYALQAVRSDDRKVTFEGKLDGRELSLDEVVEGDEEQERIAFNLLRDNRHVIAVEKRAAGRETFLITHSIGCTREGTSILRGDLPKCVVTGGMGTIAVQHGGKTYYVC